MAAPLVEMHARLSQLTRQTKEIARGDYTQRIDFMGEFSDAFNAMVVLLEERERTLTDEIARREQAEKDLERERDLLVAGPVVTFRWDVNHKGTVQYVFSQREHLRLHVRGIHQRPARLRQYRGPGGRRTDQRGPQRQGARRRSRARPKSTRITDAEGESRWVRDFTHTVRGDDGTVTAYEGYIIDITTQKAAERALRQREEQLRMLSLSDGLTGLYNRRGLFALGEHIMRSARRRADGARGDLIDVDGLKDVNNRFGHAQGDEALRCVADVIRASIRESDVAGRVGGDEFVVLAEDGPDVTQELGARLAPPRRARRSEAQVGRSASR